MLPAYAGMIRTIETEFGERKSAPRVCGDDPIVKAFGNAGKMCSPRMRG